ncbi:MAG: methyl-accepting chemotaxis protein, partial [Bacillota bacterium]
FIIALSIAVVGLTRASYQINEIANKDIEILEVAQDIQFEDLTLTDAVRGIMIDPSSAQDLEVYNAYAEKIGNSINRMMVIDPGSKKTFDQIDALNVRLIELETEIMNKAAIEPQEAINIYKGEYSELRGQLQGTMDKFVSDKKQSVANNAKQEGQSSATMRNISIIVGIVSIIVCMFVCSRFLRSIINPVRLLAGEATKIASGDLTAKEIKVNSKNEVGQLAEAFNAMFQSLKDIINQLNEESQLVASSAEQLSASAENVSAGANETAASIHEVASTVEQVTQNTQKIADASNQADAFAKEGNEGINEVTMQMGAIKKATTSVGEVIRDLNESNIKISQIVSLITQIADQTNLLALNAAIEAARA